MNKNLKLLISSTLVVLNFSTFQVQSSEDLLQSPQKSERATPITIKAVMKINPDQTLSDFRLELIRTMASDSFFSQNGREIYRDAENNLKIRDVIIDNTLTLKLPANESRPSGIQLKRVADDTLEELKITIPSREIEKRRRLDIPPITPAEVASDDPFKSWPEEIMIKIFAAVISLNDGAIGGLPVVCKGWQSLIKRHKIDILQLGICNRFLVDKETCGRFLNGKLIYKPNADNDEGKIELRIADLANPLEGQFDLSQCGWAGECLSISTGYWKKEKAEKYRNKLAIWLTPRFLVAHEITGSASCFKRLFKKTRRHSDWPEVEWPETAPIGIFWTRFEWGDEMRPMTKDRYGNWYFLTNQSMETLSNNNLYEKWGWSEGGEKHLTYNDDFNERFFSCSF